MAVCSLFDICVDYIARNVRLVESFIGFPDTVARKIFSAVERTGQMDLKQSSVSLEILSLFTTAYPDVLTALNMAGEHLLLAECLDHIVTFSHLSAMDVSCCCIGDNHELLYHISTLKCLKVVVLRSNNLTDEGIRKLTAPVRVNKTGPLSLQTLDLSENGGVTVSSVKFLRVFRELQLLNLSGTAIAHLRHQRNASELESYAEGQSLAVVTPSSRSWEATLTLNAAMTLVSTQGWAAGLLTSWHQDDHHHHHHQASQSQRNHLESGGGSTACSFYSSSRRRLEKTAVASCSTNGSSGSRDRERERGSSSSSSSNPLSPLILIHTTLVYSSPLTSVTSDLHACNLGGDQPASQGDRCVCGGKGHTGRSVYEGVGHPHQSAEATGGRDRDCDTQRSRVTVQAQSSVCEVSRTKRGRDSHAENIKVIACPRHTKKVRVEKDAEHDAGKGEDVGRHADVGTDATGECGDDELMLLQQYGYTG